MKLVNLTLAVAIVALAAPIAIAQVVRGDQIVAQSNYVSGSNVRVPQVSLVVRADFVLFSLHYETGTRSENERASELEKTFVNVTQRAARTNGDIVVEVGQPGSSGALETAAIKEVVVNREDRSSIDLVLKVAVKPNETFDAVRARTEKFVADTQVSGRVEGVIGDSQFLGLTEPKKHRETLVQAIAADVRMMQAAFGGPNSPVTVNLGGLDGRVQSRPVGPLDLEIYIPYSMSLSSGADD